MPTGRAKANRLALLVALSSAALQGCATSYQVAQRESQAVREAVALTSGVPVTLRASCINRALVRQGLNPSGLRILPDAGRNITVAPGLIGPDMPQVEFDLETKRFLIETGFTVHLGKAQIDPEKVRYILSVNLTAYTPLSQSVSGVDDLDLLVIGATRDMLVAQGSVRATAVLYLWDGSDFVGWTSSQAAARFYMVKDRKNFNVALTTGRATAGTGRERIDVSSVQDAAISVVHDAAASAVARALSVNC